MKGQGRKGKKAELHITLTVPLRTLVKGFSNIEEERAVIVIVAAPGATASMEKQRSALLEGLAVKGKLIVIGASDESIEIPSLLLLSGRRSVVVGWARDYSIDSQEILSFVIHSEVRSINEVFPLERASEA